MAEHRTSSSDDLRDALQAARPGDTISVFAGPYDRRCELRNLRATLAQPLLIRAGDQQWISGGQIPNPNWGLGTPATDSPGSPSFAHFAFIAFRDCSYVVIEGLKLQDFWPSIFYFQNCDHITIRGCALRDGTYAIFAKGEKTSYLLIEGNSWHQDSSRGHLLWTQIDWVEAHGDEGGHGTFRYFNGGFLAAKKIRGNVIVRRNLIADAYNGIHMKFDDAAPSDPTLAPSLNANVYIYENAFVRNRDNPIEPEVCAHNWHVRHNRLVDCHGWFSFDGVTGGYWYLYGNTGQFRSRQGLPNMSAHTMGRVLKLSYQKDPRDVDSERTASLPWYVFNNSWYLRCPIIGGANGTLPSGGTLGQPVEGPDFVANLAFFNNAFVWCDLVQDGPWVCELVELIRNFDAARSAGTTFDYDICDRPDYFDYFRNLGRGETNGLLATEPIFVDGWGGQFDPAPQSAARDTGWVGAVGQPGTSDADIRMQGNGKLNRGAVQDYGLIRVPALEAQADRLLTEFGSPSVPPLPDEDDLRG